MNFIVRILVVVFFSLHLAASVTIAHETVSDEAFISTMHVAPNDAPIAGEKSEITIQFDQSPTGFLVQDCACLLEIAKTGQLVTTIDIVSSVTPIRVNYIFKEPGEYMLRFSGTSKTTPPLFSPFSTEYTVTVKSSLMNSGNGNNSNIFLFVSGSIVITLLWFGGYYWYRKSLRD
jgi:hypothetical protein